MRSRLRDAFAGRAGRAVVALWLSGVVICLGTAALAWSKVGLAATTPYLLAGLFLGVLAVAVARGATWAQVLSLVGAGGQGFAAVAAAVELAVGVSRLKADEMNRLGIDPAAAVAFNVLYSAVAFAVFVWLCVRLARAGREPVAQAPPVP